jgi:Trypsin-like peptidase domain
MIKLGKRHRILRAIALVLAATFVSACATGIGPGANLTAAEKMMWSTYAVATSKAMATCVVVNRRDPSAPGGIVPVLVTSAHVLSVAPHGPYFLAIRTPNPAANPNVSILEFEPAWLAEPAYVRHPQHDIAALELRIPPEMADVVSVPSFINENAIARRGDEPHVGEPISVLGFPTVFPGTEGAFAILRAGRIASYSAGSSRDWEKFLINASVYSGDSGGPVFAARRRGAPKLLGVVTERIGKKPGAVPLAVAVNASVIRETLQLLAERDRRFSDKRVVSNTSRSSASRGSRVKLMGPPGMFIKVVHAKLPSALPIPGASR